LESPSASLRLRTTTTRLNAHCGHHHDAFAAAQRFADGAVLCRARQCRVRFPRRAHDEMPVEHRDVVEYDPGEPVTPRLLRLRRVRWRKDSLVVPFSVWRPVEHDDGTH